MRRAMTTVELLAIIGILTVAVVISVVLGERFGGWGYAAGAIVGVALGRLTVEVGNAVVRRRWRQRKK